LAVTADTPFKIEFDNKDAGVLHNVSIYAPGPATLFQKTPVPGPGVVTFDVGALKAGQYKFQCDVHPTTMFGTFIVAAK
jgi:plastocyanin